MHMNFRSSEYEVILSFNKHLIDGKWSPSPCLPFRCTFTNGKKGGLKGLLVDKIDI